LLVEKVVVGFKVGIMRVRREEAWEKALRFERWAMRKALKRVETAERWVLEGRRLTSDFYHWCGNGSL
jgi:hypothetical protein